MVGDYFATAISPNQDTANAIIEIAHAPTGTAFDEATYDARLALTGGTHQLGTEPARINTANPGVQNRTAGRSPTAQ